MVVVILLVIVGVDSVLREGSDSVHHVLRSGADSVALSNNAQCAIVINIICIVICVILCLWLYTREINHHLDFPE
jgi:hypothetical protein